MSDEYNGSIAPAGTLTGSLDTALGKDGKSAYQIAVDNGFEGTEAEWLESLKCKIQEGSVKPEHFDRAYWQMEARNPVMGFDYLDNLIDESVSDSTVYRVEFSNLSPVKSVVGEGSFIAIVRGDQSGLYLFNITTGEGWIYEKGVYELVPVDGELREISDKGAEITLTIEQVYALDKMFELAAYKDDAVAEVYKGFISAFGLDNYRAMRVLDGSELFEGRLSSYWNPATNTDHDWKQVNASLDENGNALADGIPYAYQNRADGSSDRTCYPRFDIPAEGGYKYQVYFEANEGVQLALDFYNQNVLDARDNNENWNTDDYKTNFGWQDSMGKEWEPPKEINGSPVKAMRLNFSQKNAGIKKVIIYRKKVTEDADS